MENELDCYERVQKQLERDRKNYEEGFSAGYKAGRKQAKEDLINLIKNSTL